MTQANKVDTYISAISTIGNVENGLEAAAKELRVKARNKATDKDLLFAVERLGSRYRAAVDQLPMPRKNELNVLEVATYYAISQRQLERHLPTFLDNYQLGDSPQKGDYHSAHGHGKYARFRYHLKAIQKFEQELADQQLTKRSSGAERGRRQAVQKELDKHPARAKLAKKHWEHLQSICREINISPHDFIRVCGFINRFTQSVSVTSTEKQTWLINPLGELMDHAEWMVESSIEEIRLTLGSGGTLVEATVMDALEMRWASYGGAYRTWAAIADEAIQRRLTNRMKAVARHRKEEASARPSGHKRELGRT